LSVKIMFIPIVPELASVPPMRNCLTVIPPNPGVLNEVATTPGTSMFKADPEDKETVGAARI
jgi:hypothetical protein